MTAVVHQSCSHKTYRLTCEEYDDLMRLAGYACQICGGTQTALDVDHDHAKGLAAVRGLLCRLCNLALGQVDRGAEPTAEERAYLAAPWWRTVGKEYVTDARTAVRTFKVSDDLWLEAQAAAARQGEPVSTVLRLCLNAYIADPNATVAALANVRAGR